MLSFVIYVGMKVTGFTLKIINDAGNINIIPARIILLSPFSTYITQNKAFYRVFFNYLTNFVKK